MPPRATTPEWPTTVSDLMEREVVTATPDMPVPTLARLLRDHRVSGVPVVDAEGHVVGTVSSTDLLWLCEILLPRPHDRDGAHHNRRNHANTRTVGDVMTPDVFGVRPEDSLEELCRFMARTGLRRAPVMEDGRLVGMVSFTDLLALMADDAEGDGAD